MNLLYACEKGDFSLVKYYSKINDIDIKNFYGNTGLILAVRNGFKNIAEYLLGLGANANARNHVTIK